MKKRLLILLVVSMLSILLYIICNVAFIATEPEQHNYNPMGIGSFKVIETSTIDPATILSALDRGDQNVFNFEPGLSIDDRPFIPSVEWSQEDFKNLAASIYHVAWKESEKDWKLSKMGYYTDCDHLDGFSLGEFFFYLETPGNRKYFARGIRMEPESAYVAWGGDTYFYRPFFRWGSIKSIDLKEMTVTAEEALRRAETSGGMEARRSWEGCRVSVTMWPDAFGRYDWRVSYWDNYVYNINRNAEFWIPAK